jgi:hypothetical protein
MNTYKTKDSLQHPVVIIKRKRRKNLGRKSNKKKNRNPVVIRRFMGNWGWTSTSKIE